MKGKCCLLALLAALPLGAQEITDACQERAEALVREMTLEEKIAFVGGSRDGFHLGPFPGCHGCHQQALPGSF